MKKRIWFREGWKILWEKEKMHVASIFSFSHHVFKRLWTLFQGRHKSELCGKELNVFSPQPVHIAMLSWHFFHQYSTGTIFFNPLPHMPILGSFNSAANKAGKNIDKWGYNYLLE